MTAAEEGAETPTPGTTADYYRFLNWAETKGELPGPMVQNWRNAANNVLAIDGDDWMNINLVHLDIDAQLSRFEVLKRTAYAESSMGAYKSRFRTGVEAYRVWLANPGSSTWKPKGITTSRPKTGNGDKVKKKSNVTVLTTDEILAMPPAVDVSGGIIANRPGMIEYPFPIRPGVQARIALPEDLSEKEAKRVARFIETLAISEQLAITDGSNN